MGLKLEAATLLMNPRHVSNTHFDTHNKATVHPLFWKSMRAQLLGSQRRGMGLLTLQYFFVNEQRAGSSAERSVLPPL